MVGGPGEGDEEATRSSRKGHRPKLSSVDNGRVFALSDGVFAIAGTLLVLDLHLPNGLGDLQLRAALARLLPSLAAYAISYVLIGMFWYWHHAQFRRMTRIRPPVMIVNMVLLGMVTLMPFTTQLLSEYASDHLSGALYAANTAAVLLLHGTLGWIALHHGDTVSPSEGGSWDNMVIRPMTGGAVFLVSVPVGLLAGTLAASLTWLGLPLVVAIRNVITRTVRTRHAAVH